MGKRKWIIASGAIAIGATLVLVGFFFQQPSNPTTTTITCQTTKFEFERPFYDIRISEWVKNTYADDDGTSTTVNLYVGHYDEGSDDITMRVNVSAKVPNGFVKSVSITFWEDYRNSQLEFYEVQSWPKYFSKAENLSITDYVHFLQTSGLKAFVELAGISHPKTVYFEGTLEWLLRSPQNKSHQMEVTLGLTYFNGTAYRKAVLPIEIVVWADAGSSFETARGITAGDHIGFISVLKDPEDYYKIWVENGETIEARVFPLESIGIDLDLYLYNPNLKPVANATEEEIEVDMQEEIYYTAEVSGYWYIRVVNSYASRGWYQLSVSINE